MWGGGAILYGGGCLNFFVQASAYQAASDVSTESLSIKDLFNWDLQVKNLQANLGRCHFYKDLQVRQYVHDRRPFRL